MRIPQVPPDTQTLMHQLARSRDRLPRIIAAGAFSPTVDGRYAHWDDLRHRAPPDGLDVEEWWTAIKFARAALLKSLPLCDPKGRPFVIAIPDPLQRILSETDRDLSGRVAIPEPLTTPGVRDRYLVSSLIEEAITSSQLEGAVTTRRVARDMLRSGRKPKNKGERMIFNNFGAMEFVRSIAKKPLTPELVFEIHRRVTDGTLDRPEDAGRLRATDDVYVLGPDGTRVHTPPPAAQMTERLATCCDFANGKGVDVFLHETVKAILLHFWMGYDHPFVDGNGRTARALFYWSMLHSGFWLCEYLSISRILRAAPLKYARSYLLTETDGNDSTYFVLYQMDVLQRAIKALHEYVRGKITDMRRAEALMKQSARFNYRQLALLTHALGNPFAQYGATAHANSHGVTRQTARTDLKKLAGMGLLRLGRSGHRFVFAVPEDLEDRLESLGGGRSVPRPASS